MWWCIDGRGKGGCPGFGCGCGCCAVGRREKEGREGRGGDPGVLRLHRG